MKNVFAESLKELLRLSGIKQQSIADATGYDLSYVNKWMSGKMLPSEKTIERTIEAISQCIFDNTSKGKTWIEERYAQSAGDVDSWQIEKELMDAYTYSKELTSKNQSTYFVHVPSKDFYNSIWDLINESDEILLIIDFFTIDRASRKALIGLEDGFYKKRSHDPNKMLSLIVCLQDSKNICYDAISLIHLMTVYSKWNFSLTNGDYASGKAIGIASHQIISGFIVEEKNKVFFVTKANISDSVVEVQNELLRVAQNVEQVFMKKSMDTFTNDKDYLKSMLSTNIKWIQGHVTELIIPDELHKQLLGRIDNISILEAERIHLLSKNVIEQESTNVLIYESALSDLIATGVIDFYNNRIVLNAQEIEDFLFFLMEVVKTCNITLISDPLFPEFKHTFSPCLYISDTVCYMRIEDAYDRDNIYEITDRRIRSLFDNLISDIRINRTDAIIIEKATILERLENYRTMARV